MALYPEGSFFSREQLKSSKLNTMINAINIHVHDNNTGLKVDLSVAFDSTLPSSLGGTGVSNPSNILVATEKLVIPLNEPTDLVNGCIWIV